MKEFLNFIRPPEGASWKEENRWKWNVCLSLLVLFGGGAVLWETTARAGDVDKKIAAAIEPIAKEQKQQGDKLDHVSRLLTESLANAKAAQIRLVISKRCKTTGYAERDELLREKDRLQEEYAALKGARYAEPACSDL